MRSISSFFSLLNESAASPKSDSLSLSLSLSQGDDGKERPGRATRRATRARGQARGQGRPGRGQGGGGGGRLGRPGVGIRGGEWVFPLLISQIPSFKKIPRS